MTRVLVVGRDRLATAVTDRIAVAPDIVVEATSEFTAGGFDGRVDCVVLPVGAASVDRLGYLGRIRASNQTFPVAVALDGTDTPRPEPAGSATAVIPLEKTESTLVPWIRNIVARSDTDTDTDTDTDGGHAYEQFGSLVEHTPAMIAVLDAAGRYRYVNEAVGRVLGYDPEQLLGHQVFDSIHEEDRQRVSEQFATTVDDRVGQHTVEYRYRHPDGVWRVVRSWWHNCLDVPAIGGVVATTRDVSRQTMAEQFVDGMYTFDENLLVVAANDSALEMTGYRRGEALGSHVSRFLDDVNRRKAAQTRERLVKSDSRATTVELSIRRKDGSTFPAEVRFCLVDPTADKYTGSVGVIQDITDSKKRKRDRMTLYRGP